MKVLGLSFGFHDSAAALLIDGRIVASGGMELVAQLERDGYDVWREKASTR